MDLIRKIKLVNEYNDFRDIISNACREDQEKNLKILDIGRSSREYSYTLKEIASEYITADINKFDGIVYFFEISS